MVQIHCQLWLIANRQILVYVAPKSAAVLHQTLVTTTFNAPMSYFEATENSVILNRFSQDMTLIDFQLPMSVWLLIMSMKRSSSCYCRCILTITHSIFHSCHRISPYLSRIKLHCRNHPTHLFRRLLDPEILSTNLAPDSISRSGV
jgi:hypothetical protein